MAQAYPIGRAQSGSDSTRIARSKARKLITVKIAAADADDDPAMKTASYRVDPQLLGRYERSGPRYTSYPTAPQFHTRFGPAALCENARASNDEPIPRALSLYVHVPFCFGPCFYCACTKVITRDRRRAAPYVRRLLKEAGLIAPRFDQDREVVQLHLGGGTPNFLDCAEIAELIEGLRKLFTFAREAVRDFSIELDPRSVTPGDIAELVGMGFNRASLGVQDFDSRVQEAVNRTQSVEETLAILDACRRHGMRSVNVDLIYGLPCQTLDGFAQTLDVLTAARPERLAIYSYAHMPTLFKPQTRIRQEDLPGPSEKALLLQLAIEKLSQAGYRYIGMDHFALPSDDLARSQAQGSLQRNFMGYTTHAQADLLGLGVSAISHVGYSYSQNHRELGLWENAIDSSRLPTARGMQMNADDVLRADLIQQLMCQGQIDIATLERRYGIEFKSYFAPDLERLSELRNDQLVVQNTARIEVTEAGRLLLRIVAACFDHYLHQPHDELGKMPNAH